MFYYIKGQLVHFSTNLAVLDSGGVGYAQRTTQYTIAQKNRGEEAKLFTHFYVREDLMELYGFISEEEKNCFDMLIGVSGVGPKAALSILSSASPEQLALAIITGDDKALTVAPGIGKKIAQRIILELQDKLSKGQLHSESRGGTLPPLTVIPENKTNEATAALAVLGYSAQEISHALRGLPVETLSLEELIREALRRMLKGTP